MAAHLVALLRICTTAVMVPVFPCFSKWEHPFLIIVIMILALDQVYIESFAGFYYLHTNSEQHLNQRSQTVLFKTKFCVSPVLYSSFSLDLPFSPQSDICTVHFWALSSYLQSSVTNPDIFLMVNNYFLMYTHTRVYIGNNDYPGRFANFMEKQLMKKRKQNKENQSKTLVYNMLSFVNLKVIGYFPTILFDRKLSGKSLSLSYNRVWPYSHIKIDN